MVVSFIEHLCIVFENDDFRSSGVKSPCYFFTNLLVTEMLQKLFTDSRHSWSDIAQQFFAIIIKVYQIDLHSILSNDKRLQAICGELALNVNVIKSELLRGIRQNDKSPVFLESCKKFLKIISAELIEREESLGDVFDVLSNEINLTEFISNCIKIIYEHEPLQEEFVDYSLIGVLRIVEILIIKFPTIITEEEREKFLRYLLNECLFKIEDGILVDKPLYKNPKVRKTAIDL